MGSQPIEKIINVGALTQKSDIVLEFGNYSNTNIPVMHLKNNENVIIGYMYVDVLTFANDLKSVVEKYKKLGHKINF